MKALRLTLLPLVKSPPQITLALLHRVQFAVTSHSSVIIPVLLNQALSPLALARALVPRLLSTDSLALLIGLALELLHNHRVCERIALALASQYVVQRVVERVVARAQEARHLDVVFVVVDDTQNLAGLGIALDSCLAEVELGCGCFGAAADVQRVLVLGVLVLVSGKAFAATRWCVQLVHQTKALVILCQGQTTIPTVVSFCIFQVEQNVHTSCRR